jgi:hypothetical protein
MDDMERRNTLRLPGLELQPLGRPAHSHSLYRLRYPGSLPSSGGPLMANELERTWKSSVMA